MATNEEVQEARTAVEEKRERLRSTQATAQTRQSEVSNDLVIEQLRAEEARLDAALAAAGMTKADIKEASGDAFETAKTQRKAAEATAKAQGD